MDSQKIATSLKENSDTFQFCPFITPIFPYKVAGIRDFKRCIQFPAFVLK